MKPVRPVGAEQQSAGSRQQLLSLFLGLGIDDGDPSTLTTIVAGIPSAIWCARAVNSTGAVGSLNRFVFIIRGSQQIGLI